MTDFVDDGRVDLRFGTDADRNLYLLAKANGKIWKVVGTRAPPWPQEVEPSLARGPGGGVRLRAPVRGQRLLRGGPGLLAAR